jgi:hypothetical protein
MAPILLSVGRMRMFSATILFFSLVVAAAPARASRLNVRGGKWSFAGQVWARRRGLTPGQVQLAQQFGMGPKMLNRALLWNSMGALNSPQLIGEVRQIQAAGNHPMFGR